MSTIKELTLRALQCPVRRSVDEAWKAARAHVWLPTTTGLRYDPDGAVDAMQANLGQLVRKGILTEWQVMLHENWGRLDNYLEVQYRTEIQSFRSKVTYHVW